MWPTNTSRARKRFRSFPRRSATDVTNYKNDHIEGKTARRDDHVLAEFVKRWVLPPAILDVVRAVFQIVLNTDGRTRQLAALAHEVHRQPHPVGESGAENKAARFDGKYPVGRMRICAVSEVIRNGGKSRGSREERCDVLEHDPGLREIGYISDQGFDFFGCHEGICLLE